MAERPSVKDILAKVRSGEPPKPAENAAAAPEPEVEAADESIESAAEETAAPAVPAPAPSLGRPLTLKEKLAAARAGAAAPAPAPKPAAAPKPKPAAAEAPAAAGAPAGDAPKSVPAPAPSLGRPLTLKEKLAAAKAGAAAPAPAAASAKPAASKPAAAKAAPAAKAARALPPLAQMSDPKDLAEALRQAGAKKTQEAAAKAREGKPKAAPKTKESKTAPARPARSAALADEGITRRAFVEFPWVASGWTAFTAGMAAFSAMSLRFMFPNVLAEPPSTIKIGFPADYAKEDVSERYKAEWGFWVVRSERFSGQDIIYALQSVCTHLGCPPNWLAAEQKFKCPCHGSGFYISGVNFEGPAPRPLERFRLVVADDGQLMVDKSQKFQEELQQWKDPDSFIPVA